MNALSIHSVLLATVLYILLFVGVLETIVVKKNNKKLINREIKLQDFFPMEEIHSLNEKG